MFFICFMLLPCLRAFLYVCLLIHSSPKSIQPKNITPSFGLVGSSKCSTSSQGITQVMGLDGICPCLPIYPEKEDQLLCFLTWKWGSDAVHPGCCLKPWWCSSDLLSSAKGKEKCHRACQEYPSCQQQHPQHIPYCAWLMHAVTATSHFILCHRSQRGGGAGSGESMGKQCYPFGVESDKRKTECLIL